MPAAMRVRGSHILGPITKVTTPSHMIFFDSESFVSKPQADRLNPLTKVRIHSPRLIVAEAWSRDEIEVVERGKLVRRRLGTWRLAPFGGQEPPTPETPNPAYGVFPLSEYGRSKTRLCDAFWIAVDGFMGKGAGHSKRKRGVYLLAHNVGYDVVATGGIPRLAASGWQMEAIYEKGLIYIARFSRGKEERDRKKGGAQMSFTCLSSTNFWSAKLATIGKAFGVEKLKVDYNTEDEAELLAYCRRDVEVLRKSIAWLVDFLWANGDPNKQVGPFSDTISSIAFKAFRYKYMEHTIRLHINVLATALERLAYDGGRNEAGFIGRPEELPRPMYVLDANALYPSQMIDHDFPTRLEATFTDTTPAKLCKLLDAKRLVIADVTIEIRDPVAPLKRSKLLFPIGKFRTALCTPELELVRDHGFIREVHAVAIYEGAPIFKQYVAKMWEGRRAALDRVPPDEALSLLFKNLNNNLYGKFGQEKEEVTRVGDAPPDAVKVERFAPTENQPAYVEYTYGGGIYRTSGVKHEAFNSFPAIAAFVTSYGRVHLWNAITTASRENFFYCDSVTGDTLVATEDGDVPIEALFEAQAATAERGKEVSVPTRLRAYAVDQRGRVSLRPVRRVIRHRVAKRVFRVNFSNDAHVDVTEDHSLMAAEAASNWHTRRIVECSAERLSSDSRVTSLALRYRRGRTVKDRHYSRLLYEFAGYFVGDGSLSFNNGYLNAVRLAGGKDAAELVRRIIEPMRREGWFKTHHTTSRGDVDLWADERWVGLLKDCYTDNDQRNSMTKRVPPWMLYESEEHIAAFLRGYFSADGTVMMRPMGPIVRATSINRRLLLDIQRLLSCMGCASNIFHENVPNNSRASSRYRPTGSISYHVTVRDRAVFRKRIGFVLRRKNERLDNSKTRYRTDGGWDVALISARSITPIETPEYVYDLEVAGVHTFFGNGIALHNTDSVHVNQQGRDNLASANWLSETELGKLKVEGEAKTRADPVQYFGAKSYIFGPKRKMKGVPEDAARGVRVVKGKLVEGYAYSSWPKSHTWMRRGSLDEYLNVEIFKKADVTYDKGSVPEGGGRVTPLVLDEDEGGVDLTNIPDIDYNITEATDESTPPTPEEIAEARAAWPPKAERSK